MIEAYVKRFPTGLLCLALMWTAPCFAQEDAPQQPAQQQAPPQPQQPQQQPAQTAPEKQEPETKPGTTRLPPAPPKVVDVRMPGEAGWYIGLTGWVPVGNAYIDKGKQADFTGSTFFKYPGTSK